MNNQASSEMTRQQKEEFANRRMNEMKLKNQQIAERHQEVEKDRMEAEKQHAAVTALPKTKPLPKSTQDSEEYTRNRSNQKFEREWDIGKGDDGDWSSSKEHEYDTSRNQRRGGYNSGWNQRNDMNRRPREDYNKRDNYRSYDNNKWSDSNRENGRRQNSFRGRGSFENTRNYNKPGAAHNWPEDSKRGFHKNQSHSNYNNQNSYSKMQSRHTTDKMWQNEGMNEVQHKQNRVENWVKSINSVDEWTENEDKMPVNSTRHHNNSSRRADMDEQKDHGFNFQKQNFGRNKGQNYDEFPQKSNANYGDKSYDENHRRSTYREENHASNYKLKVTVSNEPKSFIERQTEMHMRGKLVRHNFNQEDKTYDGRDARRQEGTDKSHDKHSDSWSGKDRRGPQKKNDGGNWSDDENEGQESRSWNVGKNRNHQNKKLTGNWDVNNSKSLPKKENSGGWADDNSQRQPKKENSGNWSDEDYSANPTKNISGNWGDAECKNQPDKKDSESWTDIDSAENDTHSSKNRSSKVKKMTKQSHDNNNRKDYKFSSTWNNENRYPKKDVTTWEGVAKHRPGTQGSWNTEKRNKIDSGTLDDVDREKTSDENRLKGQTKFFDQNQKRDLKCTGSWGGEKFDKQKKTGGTWSDEDVSQNCDENACRKQSSHASNKTSKPSNVSVEFGRSKSFQGASNKSNSTKNFKKKDSGTWSDQESDNPTDCVKWDISNENNKMSNKENYLQKNSWIKDNNNDTVSIVNKDINLVDGKQEFNNQNLDKEMILKPNNEKSDETFTPELNSQLQDQGECPNHDTAIDVSEEATKNKSFSTVSNTEMEDCNEDQSFKTLNNAAQLLDEIHSTEKEHIPDFPNATENFQQSVSEDSAFLESCSSEVNDSKTTFHELEVEKSSDTHEDSLLCLSSQTEKTEVKNQCEDLSESNIDSGALSTTNVDELVNYP